METHRLSPIEPKPPGNLLDTSTMSPGSYSLNSSSSPPSSTTTTSKLGRISKAVAGGKHPVQVARRNERERKRVQQVNNGFVRLRNHVPVSSGGGGGVIKNKKLSKVETLRQASKYIEYLRSILDVEGTTTTTTTTTPFSISSSPSPPHIPATTSTSSFPTTTESVSPPQSLHAVSSVSYNSNDNEYTNHHNQHYYSTASQSSSYICPDDHFINNNNINNVVYESESLRLSRQLQLQDEESQDHQLNDRRNFRNTSSPPLPEHQHQSQEIQNEEFLLNNPQAASAVIATAAKHHQDFYQHQPSYPHHSHQQYQQYHQDHQQITPPKSYRFGF